MTLRREAIGGNNSGSDVTKRSARLAGCDPLSPWPSGQEGYKGVRRILRRNITGESLKDIDIENSVGSMVKI